MRSPARALFVALGALLAFGVAPAYAAGARAEVVVELRAPPVSEQAPLTQLRDRRGHVDLQRLGPRLALAALARQQRAAELRLQAAAPGLHVSARMRIVMDALVVTLPRSELGRLVGRPGVRSVWPAVTYVAQADDTAPVLGWLRVLTAE